MFIEPHKGTQSGWIEVICGSMFSGKTEELLRRLRRAKIANQKIEIFKPKVDTRYDVVAVVSHDTNKVDSIPISHSQEILLMVDDAAVVGIDEVQFLDEHIVSVATDLAAQGRRVIIAGLDMDFQGRPFGPMGSLLAIADYITKLHAICMRCGGMATFSYRKVSNDARVMLGEQESYEPRCRSCYNDE